MPVVVYSCGFLLPSAVRDSACEGVEVAATSFSLHIPLPWEMALRPPKFEGIGCLLGDRFPSVSRGFSCQQPDDSLVSVDEGNVPPGFDKYHRRRMHWRKEGLHAIPRQQLKSFRTGPHQVSKGVYGAGKRRPCSTNVPSLADIRILLEVE